jgi:hypothetical protein
MNSSRLPITNTDFAAMPIALLAEQLYIVSSSIGKDQELQLYAFIIIFVPKSLCFAVNLQTAINYVFFTYMSK